MAPEERFHGSYRYPRDARPVITIEFQEPVVPSPGFTAVEFAVGEPGHERVVFRISKPGTHRFPEVVRADVPITFRRAIDLPLLVIQWEDEAP